MDNLRKEFGLDVDGDVSTLNTVYTTNTVKSSNIETSGTQENGEIKESRTSDIVLDYNSYLFGTRHSKDSGKSQLDFISFMLFRFVY